MRGFDQSFIDKVKAKGLTITESPKKALDPSYKPVLSKSKETASTGKKTSKYRNNRVKDADGVCFDSEKELKRWRELQLLYHAGEIDQLRRQVFYELNPGGTFSYRYKADFVYIEKGETIVEDAKGYATPIFKKKDKLMRKVHGIIVKLT